MAARLPRTSSSLARPLAPSKPLSSSSSLRWSRSQATLSAPAPSHSGSKRSRYGVLAGLLLVGAGGAGLLSSTYTEEPDFQTSRLATAYRTSANKSYDPLDILDPDVLSSSSAHLRSLPLSQLFRAYLVFLTSQSSFVVDIAPSAVTAFEKIRDTLPFGAGQAVWHAFLWSMRHTFFAQFVAGESVTETYPLLEKLYNETHTGAMLNWSAEAEHATLSAEESESEQSMVLGPAMGELRRAVLAAADFRKEQQVKPTTLAIKLTGLVQDPAVFQRSTDAILSSTANARGQLDTTTLVPHSPLLTPADVATLNGLHDYLRTLCSIAQDRGLRIVFDAEQSWFQPSLDRLVTSLSREFNRPSSHGLPVVYNTYQANLRGCEAALRRDLADSKQHGYNLGIKIVRGAYVVSENAHALKRKEESKVWSSKQETDKCFDTCSAIILDEIDETIVKERKDGPAVIFATHNAGSVKRSIQQLRDRSLVRDEGDHLVVDDRIRGRVAYAQLLAMADSLTAAMSTLFPPSQAGKDAIPINSLYIPYGKIGEVLPYLVRRAQENKSILQGSDGSGRGGAAAQRRAIGREIRRRAFGFSA